MRRDILFQVTKSKAIPIKCLVSHRPPSREGGSVGRAKKKKKGSGCQGRPGC